MAVGVRLEQSLHVLRHRDGFRLIAEVAALVLAPVETQVGDAAVGDQLEDTGELLLVEHGEQRPGLVRVHEAWLGGSGARLVHPGELLHRRDAIIQLATLDFGVHASQRFGDGDDLPSGRVQRGGADRLAFAEEQQQTLVGEVGGDEPVDAPVPIALGEGEEVVEVDEREPGAVNQLARLRKLQIREAHRGVREASRARAHRPPGGLRRQDALNPPYEAQFRRAD